MGNSNSSDELSESETKIGTGKSVKKDQRLRLVEPHEEGKVVADGTDFPGYKIPFDRYRFPFENVVFEGGGSRVFAHCGVVRVLEESGIWLRVRRVAGAGTGALTAALLAVGYNSYQLEQLLNQDWTAWLNDHSCGYCCLGPNLKRNLGWNEAARFTEWLAAKMKDATGKQYITFREAYHLFNKELCVVVSNVSQGEVEFCHAKTTPDMPVVSAVRMSLTQPGMTQPYRYRRYGREDVLLDGSLMCSYPINAYDGWWLSMKPSDNFLQKLNPLKNVGRMLDGDERFGLHNEATIGVMLYSDSEHDVYSTILQHRNKSHQQAPLPHTALLRAYEVKDIRKSQMSEKYAALAIAVDYFLEALKDLGLEKNKSLSRRDINALLTQKSSLTEKDLMALFGENRTADSIIRAMHPASTSQVTLQEMISYFDRKGLRLYNRYMQHRHRTTATIEDLFANLRHTLAISSRQYNTIKTDMERTVGVNCHHVAPSDQALDVEDKIFLIEQGRRSTLAFLQYFITKRTFPVHLNDDDDVSHSFRRDELALFIDDELSEIIDLDDYNEELTEV